VNCFAHDAGQLLVDLAAKFSEAVAHGDAHASERWASAAFALRGEGEFVDGDEPDKADR
jgi:hypothetical protein